MVTINLSRVMVLSALFACAVGLGAQQPPAQTPPPKVVVGYVQDWDMTPDLLAGIAYDKITHLNIAFANPTDDQGDLSVPPLIDQLVDKAHQQNVKVLISIGGGGASENKRSRDRYFSLMSDANRAAFIQKLAQYVDDHKLDGLDVDLEGPAIGKDYGAFVTDLSAVLKPKGKILSAAVSAGYGGDSVPPAALACFDLINVMAYDETGPWEPNKPGQHSSMDCAKNGIAYWLGRGADKTKLVLGVPFYGYGFGDAFTKDGYTYSQIVQQFPGAEMSDQVGKTIWYNGIPTIQAKTKFVIDQGLGGLMIWSIDQDAKGKQSLLAAIHDALTAKTPR